MLFHIQELDTVTRFKMQMVLIVWNDGGYGAEVHKFRANDITTREAIHGLGDLAATTGFGLRGASVT